MQPQGHRPQAHQPVAPMLPAAFRNVHRAASCQHSCAHTCYISSYLATIMMGRKGYARPLSSCTKVWQNIGFYPPPHLLIRVNGPFCHFPGKSRRNAQRALPALPLPGGRRGSGVSRLQTHPDARAHACPCIKPRMPLRWATQRHVPNHAPQCVTRPTRTGPTGRHATPGTPTPHMPPGEKTGAAQKAAPSIEECPCPQPSRPKRPASQRYK